MKSGKPLYVAFLWHMHQPWYLWNREGEASMPWARLHALKDYYDMPKLAVDIGIPVTFNYVPSLLKQIELMAEGKCSDPYWKVLSLEMDDMDESQLNLVITQFFNVNYANYIKVSPRYSELYAKRGKTYSWRMFSPQDIRDLQVHFLLAWFGESLKEHPEVKRLIIKDENYTVEEKHFLIDVANQRIKEIIPYLKSIWSEGRVALTFSPYYHPILPLLCDVSLAKAANPTASLPRKPFVYPADAVRHIEQGIEYFEEKFGKKPAGMWPPEGSVADEILSILINAGVEYSFTDEDILRKSIEISTGEPADLTPKKLYSPYKFLRGGRQIFFFFRDKKLSDKIGFEYHRWNDDDAAVGDFVASLNRIRDALPDDDRDYVVSIILDGENAWEYYRHNGKPFLTKLYSALLENPDFEPITFEEYLARAGDAPILERLAPGSWINADFSTWCGSPEKNRAWELLADARNTFQMNLDNLTPKLQEMIMHYLMVAEGSDWFWWFGDTNYTPYIDYFDALFRHQLRRVYELMDMTPPKELDEPVYVIKHPAEPVRRPIQFMTPSLEGKTTSYFEWSSAGLYKATGFRGTMYSVYSIIVERLFYGFDMENLYLRLDSKRKLTEFLRDGGEFVFDIFSPRKMELRIFWSGGIKWEMKEITDSEEKPIEPEGVKVVCDEICEMKIPFKLLGAEAGDAIQFVLYARQDSQVLQRFPSGGRYIEIIAPYEDFEDSMWYV
ncbi:MAG: glycoside hydrolase [Deltaproteobacteria bacterium]|nr:MAG: glycoside hydrolase [Deltaproteobacteria bacterium]